MPPRRRRHSFSQPAILSSRVRELSQKRGGLSYWDGEDERPLLVERAHHLRPAPGSDFPLGTRLSPRISRQYILEHQLIRQVTALIRCPAPLPLPLSAYFPSPRTPRLA